jgi:hypothetical protein
MPDCGRNDVAIIFKMVALFLKATERASEVACDAGLLGNDKYLGHLEMQPNLNFAPIANCKMEDAGEPNPVLQSISRATA